MHAAPAAEQPAAQPGASMKKVDSAEVVQTVQVVLDGERLFRVRGLSSYPARQRAEVVAERIREVARDETIPVSAVHVDDAGDRTRILAGERLLLTVYDLDADAEQMESRQLLAEVHTRFISGAIERYRHERGGAYLQRQGIQA